MKDIFNKLINHDRLTKNEAYDVIINIAEGKLNDSQIASFLTIFMMRRVNLEEIEGFKNALLDLCISIDLSEFNTIDLCGTGGDGKNTFNISTLSSFVTAGADIKVSKHGNYGVSSGCGSSNVLEKLGIHFSNDESFLKNCLDKAGICILHAPLFHPAMKNVGPVRKQLGLKTFFNMLGPLVNPSFPRNQLTGVFNLELARIYNYLFQKGNKNYTILYSLDGYDEISLTTNTKAFTHNNEMILNSDSFRVPKINHEQIQGGEDIISSANIFMNVIQNKGTEAQQNVVCANAGIAISTALDIDPMDGFLMARESILSGKALESLKILQNLSSK
ncbi:MAG: anthranilate phosphoribosyltransferase [Flavobacteriaceae bacterium]|nr:anthranilate phosphoribosyltransferase [Flavobacteriaceae bacterium]